jgi:hypothetical protein
VQLIDPYTGVEMLTRQPNPDDPYDTSSFPAWVATRHSRAPGPTLQIMREVKEAGVDADGKMRSLLGIGHTAPADMARLQLYLDNIPVHLAHTLFHISLQHGGQEKSTRFQEDFVNKVLNSLRPYFPTEAPEEVMAEMESQYQQLGNYALASYTKLKDIVVDYFRDFYQIDTASQKQMNTLMSRSLDCARIFLLQGQTTGMSLEASAREFSRIIALLRAYPGDYYPRIAEQIERIFAPPEEVKSTLNYKGEAPGLIRHTEANRVNIDNALALETFLLSHTDLLEKVPRITEFAGTRRQDVILLDESYHEMDRLIAQTILLSYPSMDPAKLLEWISSQSSEPGEILEQIGSIIWNEIDEHNVLLAMGATGRTTAIFNSTLAVARDLTRHRDGARFEPNPAMHGMPMDYMRAMEVINLGYVPPIHVTELGVTEAENFIADHMTEYYTRLTDFMEKVFKAFGNSIDSGFILNLLPLGHYQPIWMHLHPKQSSYLPARRVLPGGDNSYRVLAYEANQLLADTHPAMRATRFPEERRPNFRDRTEFLDRT